MFKKRKVEEAPLVNLDRVLAVAAKAAPTEYSDAGGRGLRRKRETVFKQATAISPHGEKAQVVIKNLSVSGLRVEFFQNRTLGERVLIDEPSVPIQKWAEVVWEGDGAAGLRFENQKKDD